MGADWILRCLLVGRVKHLCVTELVVVPEESVEVSLPDDTKLSVRLIDCVGYMVDGAAGLFEEGTERMVTTPWFDHEVTLTEAAEAGTERVKESKLSFVLN